MEANEESTRERLSQMSDLVAECENILFDEAPVMVYSIDESCSLLKVNRRWLAEMGYQAEEVLGHECSEFLTEECSIQVRAEVLPLYGKWGGLIALDLAYCEVTAGFLMSRWMRWSNLNRWVSAMF